MFIPKYDHLTCMNKLTWNKQVKFKAAVLIMDPQCQMLWWISLLALTKVKIFLVLQHQALVITSGQVGFSSHQMAHG